jgi:glucose-1-phosphate cytidylyltransferase
MNEIKQVVILAGGKGTRMREMTEDLPKPMVQVGDKTVLEHLINIYRTFGDFQFFICSGYKSEKIINHFKSNKDVTVFDTGLETNTGGRLFKIRDYVEGNFMITYGDGLANVKIDKLIEQFYKHGNIGTLTVTNPVSRFGLVEFDNNFQVNNFVEKPKLDGFINIGFMAFKQEFFEYLNNDSVLELQPLMELTNSSQLNAFIHKGYFEPMDTYREYLNLNKLWNTGKPPWEVYE